MPKLTANEEIALNGNMENPHLWSPFTRCWCLKDAICPHQTA